MQHNIIGDIHGRDIWNKLVRDDAVNVFLGDYLDPYPKEGISNEMAWNNFLEILDFQSQHPDTTVLLYGNHDLHYLFQSIQFSRYQEYFATRIHELYNSGALSALKLAHSVNHHTLVTHAGVTKEWWQLIAASLPDDFVVTPDSVADVLNTFVECGPELMEAMLCAGMDDIGNSPISSPIWVRPEPLFLHNLFAGLGYRQIVGHTQIDEPLSLGDIRFIDCLASCPQAFLTL